MSLESQTLQVKAGTLLEVYRKAFKCRFGQEPDINVSDDTETLRYVIEKIGFDRAKALLECYLLIEDDWLTSQGFSLRWFKNNINRVITQSASHSQTTGLRPKFVVVISVSGHPVCSHNQSEMGPNYWFKPMLWNDWVQAPYEKRAQGDPHLPGWSKSWDEWKFIEEH